MLSRPAPMFAAMLAEYRRARVGVPSSDHRRLTGFRAQWMAAWKTTPRAIAFADVPPVQLALYELQLVCPTLLVLLPNASPGHHLQTQMLEGALFLASPLGLATEIVGRPSVASGFVFG